MPRRHIVKVINKRGDLVSGVDFEVQFDGQQAYTISNSAGTYTVTGIPDSVQLVSVRATDKDHDKSKTFSAKDDSFDFVFEKAPTSGITLHSLVSLWLHIRPKFLNRLAFFMVSAGVAMASSPWWVPLVYQAFGWSDPKFEPPSDLLSGSVVFLGFTLAVIANWRTIRDAFSEN